MGRGWAVGQEGGRRGRTRERHLEAVVVVHHGRHSIVSVPVELVLVYPPSRIGEQEPHRLPVAFTTPTPNSWLQSHKPAMDRPGPNPPSYPPTPPSTPSPLPTCTVQ